MNIIEDGVLFRCKRLKIDLMTGRKVIRSKQRKTRPERANEGVLYSKYCGECMCLCTV